MSTYLLAFVVMDFDSINAERFTVWARSDAIKSAKYALEVGPKVLQFYEKFFNIPYPLPKVDMISLPDFTAGGEIIIISILVTFCEMQMLLFYHLNLCYYLNSNGELGSDNIS